MALPSQKFLNTIYTWCITRIDPQKREQWEYEMDLPLPWQINREPTTVQAEDEIQDYLNLMAKKH